jgi:hypothetical protein
MGLTVHCNSFYVIIISANLYRETSPKFYLYDTFYSVGHKLHVLCWDRFCGTDQQASEIKKDMGKYGMHI